MKDNLTEIVFILDRSGSMGGLEDDTIGGFNSTIEKQKGEEGEANITTILFDHDVKFLYKRKNIKNVRSMTQDDYYVKGCTALLDAIGRGIDYMINVQKHQKEDEKAESVLFIITTDGYENSSNDYSYNQIRKMIKYQMEKYNWQFLFLGANIDAIAAAKNFGIPREYATNYVADGKGTKKNFKVMSKAISSYRRERRVHSDWKEEAERYYNDRKKDNEKSRDKDGEKKTRDRIRKAHR